MITDSNTKGSNNNDLCGLSPEIAANINNGIIDIAKLMAEDNTLLTGYIYLGRYTLVINGALETIEPSPKLTDSEKKLNNIPPHIK